MELIPGDLPAEAALQIDKLAFDLASDQVEMLCSGLRSVLKDHPELLSEASSLTITIEVGHFS